MKTIGICKDYNDPIYNFQEKVKVDKKILPRLLSRVLYCCRCGKSLELTLAQKLNFYESVGGRYISF